MTLRYRNLSKINLWPDYSVNLKFFLCFCFKCSAVVWQWVPSSKIQDKVDANWAESIINNNWEKSWINSVKIGGSLSTIVNSTFEKNQYF